MIDKIVESISPETMMFLINAIAFDAKWQTVYNKEDVRQGEFHAPGGTREVDFMHSRESVYLEDAAATGFMKPYAGGDYSFVALLPDEGIAIEDYVKELTGQSFLNILSTAQKTPVIAALPKFSYDFTLSMNDVLADMGMTDAFSGELPISESSAPRPGKPVHLKVLHKAFISVDELERKQGPSLW